MSASPHPPIAALLAAAALALGLAACGSGGSSTSSTAAPATTGSTATTAPAGKAGKAGGGAPGSPSSPGSSGSKPEASGGAVAKGGAAPFRTKGGDNSIQEFGGEAGGSELSQAAAALHGYLDARAGEEWGKACSFMAGGVTKSLQQLAGGAQSAPGGKSGKPKHVGCPQLLAAMSAGMPAAIKREFTKADVGALRIEGQRAFLLFHGAHRSNYFMPMAKEGGQWKVAAIAASALP